MHKLIIGIDPSGNYEEGKGTTGIGYIRADGSEVKLVDVDARKYSSQLEYWTIVISYLKGFLTIDSDCVVVLEDYLLYGSKANQQINSRLETPQLIGVIKYICYKNNVPVVIQRAVDVKKRWADNILEHEGYIHRVSATKSYEHCHGKSGYALAGESNRLSSHSLDTLRHMVHYKEFKNK